METYFVQYYIVNKVIVMSFHFDLCLQVEELNFFLLVHDNFWKQNMYLFLCGADMMMKLETIKNCHVCQEAKFSPLTPPSHIRQSDTRLKSSPPLQ